MKKNFSFLALIAVALLSVTLVACNKTTTGSTATRPTTTQQGGNDTTATQGGNTTATQGGNVTTTVTGTTTVAPTTTAHEHSWDEGTVTQDPTCAQEGVKTFTCACGETKTEPIEKLAHTEEEIPAVAATCTETGLTAGKKCSVCQEVLVAQETVAALGHSFGEAKQSNAHILDGYIEMKATCSVCTAEVVTQTINLAQYDATAHVIGTNTDGANQLAFNAATKTIEVKAMTDSNGKWIRFDFAAYKEAPAKYAYIVLRGSENMCVGVKFDALNPNNKYEGTNGNKLWKSISNTTEIIVWDLEALNMDSTILQKVVFWPYATKGSGTTTGTIEILGAGLANTAAEITALHQYTNNVGSAEGHALTCACGAHLEVVAHTPVTDAAVSATCTETGLTEGSHCSVCNYVIKAQETVPANGHAYNEVALVEATPLATGVAKHYTCANCELIFDAEKNVTTAEALVIAKVTPKTVAEAITEANAASTETVYVRGYVKNGTISGKGIQLYIVDVMGNDQVFQIYNATAAEGVDKSFKPGSVVIAKGNYDVYNGKAELVSSTVIFAENPTVTSNFGTAEAPLTVTQAYSEIANFIAVPADKCYVKGYVTGADAEKKNITISDLNGSGKEVIVYISKGYAGDIVLGQYVNVVGQYQAYYEKMEITNATLTYTTDFEVKLSDGVDPVTTYIGSNILAFKTYIGINNITKFDYANGSVVATSADTLALNNCFLKALANEGVKYLTIVLNVNGGETFNHITLATFNADGWVSPDKGGYYKDLASANGEIKLEFTIADLATVISSNSWINIYTRNNAGEGKLTNILSTIEIKSIEASQYKTFTMKQNAVNFSNPTYNEANLLTGVTITSINEFKEGGGLDKSYFDYLVTQGYKFITMKLTWNVEDATSLGAVRTPNGKIAYGKPVEINVNLEEAITNELLFWVPFNGGATFDKGSIVLSEITYYTVNPLKVAGLVLQERLFNNDTVNCKFGIDLTYFGAEGYPNPTSTGNGGIGNALDAEGKVAQVLHFNRFGGLTKRNVKFYANHLNIDGLSPREGDVVIFPVGTYKDPANDYGINRTLILEEPLFYWYDGKAFQTMESAEALLTKLTTVSLTGNSWQSFDNLVYLANMLGYTKISFHADVAKLVSSACSDVTNYRFVIKCVQGGVTKYWQENGIPVEGKDFTLDLTQWPCSDQTYFYARCWHEGSVPDGHTGEGTGSWKGLSNNVTITNITLSK